MSNRNKERLVACVEKEKEIIFQVSRQIHEYSESNFKEYKSAAFLTDILEKRGFNITRKVAGMGTAFIAEYRFSEVGPRVGLLAEYDALEGLGHACGHNLIAASTVGAALALVNMADALSGSLTVFGTPAEELGGGKVIMAENECFDNLDTVVYFHPSVRDDLYGPTLACKLYEITIRGLSAHVQINPQGGRNALMGLVKIFSDAEGIENEVGSFSKIGGIVTNGGTNAIVIPDLVKAEFILSSDNDANLLELDKRFQDSVKRILDNLRLEADIRLLTNYPSVQLDEKTTAIIEEQMHYLGLNPKEPSLLMTSTDCGSTSQKCPFAGFRLSMGDPSPFPHTIEFTHASISKLGQEKALLASKIQGLSLLKVLTERVGKRKLRV